MIPIPPPVCLGQKITVDGYNQLLDVMRALQPIGGAGILLEETSNGIIFKLAEPPQSVSTGAFNHRWKVTLEGDEDGYKLHIAPGDLYLISGNGAEKQTLLLGDDIEEDQEQGGWMTKEGELSSGTHRLALLVTSEGFYKLSTLEAEAGESVLYIIASIKGPSSSNTTPSFTQLLYQDLYYWQGGAEVGPKEWALRVGSQEINGELYSTVEVYLPYPVVARYSDDPTKDNIASATQPLELQSRVVDVGGGWKVWKWFKDADPDVDLCYLEAEMTPSAWSPSVVGSSFEPAIILTSDIDGTVEHNESAVLENSPYTPSAPRARALIGIVRKRGKTISILANDEGSIRFTFVAGSFALYVQPPPSSSTPEDEGEIELVKTDDEFDATTLEEGAKLLWATVPLGSVFRDGFAFGVYDVDFSTTKKKWLLDYREAVVHSMLHFAKFLA